MQKVITSQFCVTSVDDGRDGNDGNDGTSPWVADFDNEMDSVQCDDSGYVLEEQAVSTNVRLFYGNTQKQLTIISVRRGLTSMTNGTQSSGVKVSWGSAASSVKITVTYSTTAKISGKDDFEITIRSTEDQSVTRVLHFVVNGVKGDVYNLLPSVNEIHATRDKSGNYLVGGSNAFSLRCGYSKRTISGQVTRVNDVSGKIDNKYNIYFNRHKTNGDWAGNWALYQTHKSALDMPGVTNGTLNLATYDAIRFALCENTADTVSVSTGLTGVIDEETVCIVSDGMEGYGIALTLNRTGRNNYTEANWNSWAEIGVTDSCSKYDGDDDFTKCRVGDYYMVVGYSYDLNIYHEAVYRCTAVTASKLTGVCISHIKDGSDGDGVQYVFKRFTTEQSNLSAPTKPAQMDANGEWIPSGWTDDPTGVDSTYQFEYVSSIKCIGGVWGSFEKPALWAKYSKDGDPGMGGVVAYVTPDKVYAPCNVLGAVIQKVEQELTFSLKVGSESVTVSSVTNNSKPSGVSIAAVSGSNNKKKLTVAVDAASSGFSAGAVFTVNGTYNNKSISAQCTVAIVAGWQGESGNGTPGHIGRWYEYKGVWGSDVSSVTNSKYVGYFVKYYTAKTGSHYYINTLDDGVANTIAPVNANTGHMNTGWEQISDDRMAIFTKVIFSDNAYLGSFIINGDWMISQQAAPNSPQSSYTRFNPNYPNTSYQSSNFIPMYAVDGKTGRVYMNNAFVQGTVYANNGYFKGGIYSPFVRITPSNIKNYATDNGNGNYSMSSFPVTVGGMQFEMASDVFVSLPAVDASQNGREFEILNLTDYASKTVRVQTTHAYGPAIILKQYHYLKVKVIYDPISQDYVWMKVAAMNINRALATGDTEDGAHVEIGNVVTV